MENIIKEIEDMSLNAWPSHQMQLYDGWILRFSYFYTHRTNSVEQFGTSTLPWSVKIPYCEKIYRHWNTPTIFKISPLVSVDFDYMLENRGYEIQHITNVMYLDYKNVNLCADYSDISIYHDIPDFWVTSLFNLKNTTNPIHRNIVPSMYRAIPKDVVCVCLKDAKRQIIGTGLGVLDRDYIGIYAIHVHEDYRHMGYAKQIVTSLLSEGKKKGAAKAYLQVVDGNTDAENLYKSFGFEFLYKYWFRVEKTC